MRELKIGLVGINRAAGYGELFMNHPRTEVTAICDINSKHLEEAGKEFKLKDSSLFSIYDDFINTDIDIVFIGAPISLHAEQSIKALKNHKHVLCEVTAASTIEECEKLFQTVKKAKTKYMMAENCCYFYYLQQWEKIIQQRKLGKILYAESEYLHALREMIFNKETKEIYWRANRPPLHYCSHSLGPLLMFLKDDYIIKATGLGKGINIMPDVGPGAIDMQVALFETKKGVIIKLLRSSVYSGPYHLFYSVYGTKGFVESGRGGNNKKGKIYVEGKDELARRIDCSITDPNAPEEARKGGHGTSEYFLIRDFINCIDNNTEPKIDITKALEMTVPGIIAHKAAMKGNVWLDVPHFK